MRIVALVGCLVALAAAVPTAAAADVVLTARSLDATGSTHTQGWSAVVETDDRSSSTGEPIAGLGIVASDVRAEIDWREYAVAALGTLELLPEDGTEFSNYTAVSVEAVRAGVQSYVFVSPLDPARPPQIEVAAQDIRVSSSEVSEEAHVGFVLSPRELAGATNDTHSFSAKGVVALELKGDFVVSLWDIDVEVRHATGEDAMATGTTGNRTLGIDGMAPVRRQQAYLFVRDGVLRMELQDAAGARFYLRPDRVQSDGTVHLRQASGLVPTSEGSLPLVEEDVTLHGDVRLQFLDGDTIAVRIEHADAIAVRSRSLEFVATAAPGAGATWWWAVSSALVMLLLAVARIAPVACVRRLRAAMDAGRYDRVKRVGPYLLRTRFSGEAAIALATIAVRDERPEDAISVMEQNRRWKPNLLAMRAYLEAVAYAMQGFADGARERLGRCLRLDPRLEQEARAQPLLRPFLERVRYNPDGDVA